MASGLQQFEVASGLQQFEVASFVLGFGFFSCFIHFWFLNRVWDVVMVCQAASQTRFRAWKYENGIAGSATIVVRVIACFQPLQDCQAEYFRHLLKPVT
ncbi:hypothetical protein V6N12_070240 [Hibiscus sabdariffa]|uniref:Uncharacterized protein n=1 Tax=Hibiscus sabdariffa TaxID=183260 RepID=A0ABR2FG77_9ROSI